MALFSEPVRGGLTTEGPMVIYPACHVVSLVASDDTTIDMTDEQARRIAEQILRSVGVETDAGEGKQ